MALPGSRKVSLKKADRRGNAMREESSSPVQRRMRATTIAALLALSATAVAISSSTPDKYTLKVPNGLAFAEFKGYEDWPVIAISENGGLIAAILGNREMIEAYRAGAP